MLFQPQNFVREAEFLTRNHHVSNPTSRVAIDRQCVLVTPLHRMINRLREMSRGDARHGSTGLGVGCTATELRLTRAGDADFLFLQIADLLDEGGLETKLTAMHAQKMAQAEELLKGASEAVLPAMHKELANCRILNSVNELFHQYNSFIRSHRGAVESLFLQYSRSGLVMLIGYVRADRLRGGRAGVLAAGDEIRQANSVRGRPGRAAGP